MQHSHSGFKLLSKNSSVKSVTSIQKKDSIFFNLFNYQKENSSKTKCSVNVSSSNGIKVNYESNNKSHSKNKQDSKKSSSKKPITHYYLSIYKDKVTHVKGNSNIPVGLNIFNTPNNKNFYSNNTNANSNNILSNNNIQYESTNVNYITTNNNNNNFHSNFNNDEKFNKFKRNRNSKSHTFTDKFAKSDKFGNSIDEKKEKEINKLKLDLGIQNNTTSTTTTNNMNNNLNNNNNIYNNNYIHEKQSQRRHHNNSSIGIPMNLLKNSNYYTHSSYGVKTKKTSKYIREENKTHQNGFNFHNLLNNHLSEENIFKQKKVAKNYSQRYPTTTHNETNPNTNPNFFSFRCFSFKNVRCNSLSVSKSPKPKKSHLHSTNPNHRISKSKTIISNRKNSQTNISTTYNNKSNINYTDIELNNNNYINYNYPSPELTLEDLIKIFSKLQSRAKNILIGYHKLSQPK